MNNSILILGANGQDGRVLCDFFDKNNINYDIAVRNENRFIHENQKNIFIGDLNNYKFIKEIFELNTYDKVFNFANETFVRDNSLISDSFTKTLKYIKMSFNSIKVTPTIIFVSQLVISFKESFLWYLSWNWTLLCEGNPNKNPRNPPIEKLNICNNINADATLAYSDIFVVFNEYIKITSVEITIIIQA